MAIGLRRCGKSKGKVGGGIGRDEWDRGREAGWVYAWDAGENICLCFFLGGRERERTGKGEEVFGAVVSEMI